MMQLDNAVERYRKVLLEEFKDSGIKSWIAGGAIRDYFMGIPIKTDYDLFFPDKENYDKASKYFKDHDATIIWESENGMKVKYGKRKFDLVKHFFNTPQETIEAFDFTVSMFAVDYDKVYHGESSFIDLAKRQLIFNKITFPASTVSRAFRYRGKGFYMCQGEMRKMIEAVQGMPKAEPKKESEGDGEEDKSSGDNFFSGLD